MNAMLQTMRGFGGTRVVALFGVGTILLIFFAFLSFRLASPVLSPLYTNLSMEDASQMVVELEALGATYQVSPDGKQIMVPSGDVSRFRLALAQKGLPAQGSMVGYEIFDKTDSLGTSNFVHNVNLLRALEGELARTIASFDSIANARVHLVVPKGQLFNKDRIEPSASVVLTLRNRGMPTKEEVAAVTHLVSTAVPGLKPSRITIVDNTGKLLAKGGEGGEQDPGLVSAGAQDFKTGYESRLKNMIENLLEQSVGVGKVEAQVSAEIDFDRVTTSSEVYDPDGQVARSVQATETIEKSNESDAGGDVSVVENLPEAGGGAAGATASNSVERVDETTNYEISKTITSHIKESGTIKKLSIAVLVDGKYQIEEGGEDSEGIKRSYIPRTDEELTQIRSLVETAVGYNEERGDSISIVNMQFSREIDDFSVEESAFEWLKRDFNSIIKTLVIGVVAILAILLVIRPLVNRAFEIAPGAEENAEGGGSAAGGGGLAGFTDTPMESAIDVGDIQNRVGESSAKKVTEIVDSHPEETLAVIRGWLSQR